ncbi:glycoside hydrolase family 9 protein [Serpula lacrymans var. lacrymans S7.3]|uniref:Endoglucanase n=2 Tax=Serpula lacrymans var. lacrymans TaxID=341189 RepID=F8PNY7_SERL3|nr:glycoside hydrolase family 9 protein [Serpula lacrymans var. lacrymans S7.9]EGO01864.1 glycoside hydrolase family 9 protein [Serpula lacrymans var. lacrymans S7.3]EGO27491.1 glycoside hydrolase family 9 protein [Serpula lacrymans var. lacrymans S7.9]
MRISLLSLAFLTGPVLAQVPLPQPPFMPPNASSGAVPSSSGGVPNAQWSTLLGNLLYFYEAQRSGKLPSTNRVPWRNDSAVNDGSDVHLDLSGGYYDAGDYIKCTFPLSFTVMSICWGATDFGKGYDLANQTPYLDDMLRWSLDWLMKAHPSNDTLFVQIGDTDLDNAYWGGDQNIPEPRPSYQINNTSPGTDAAAGVSAAFSACSNLYSNRLFSSNYSGPATLQNSTYAAELLQHAQTLYSFAVSASQTEYQNSVPVAGDAYASSGYGDELTLAALFLAWATNSSSLYQDAENYYTKFGLGGYDGVFNWDSKTPGIPVLFAQIAQANPGFGGGNISTWQSQAENYFDGIVNGSGSGYMTRGGLLYYTGDSDEASVNPSLNAAMLLTRYAQIASSQNKKSSYLNYAKSQVDYVLGKNPMSAPYIVGSNPNSPANPHSAMASGGNDTNNINTSPMQEAYVLYGAIVGGPDQYDRFFDIRGDWPETEVALDYNAPMLTLAAMHALNDSSDPFFTSLQPGAYSQKQPQGFPCDAAYSQGCGGPRLSKGGEIAMAVIIGVVGLTIFSLIGWLFLLSFQDGKMG